MLGGSQATSGTVDLLLRSPERQPPDLRREQVITITSTAPGGGQLTLDNGGSPAAVVVSGSGHAIDDTVAVMLDSDAWITTSGSGDSLSIAGDIINGTAAHGIVKDGLGTLILSGSDTYTGGTSVVAGTLILASGAALPDGTSLTVAAGGTLVFDPSAALASAAGGQSLAASPGPSSTVVPEPGTPVLLVTGALLATCAAWRRKALTCRPRPPSVAVLEGEIDLQHVHQRHADQAAQRRMALVAEQLLDLVVQLFLVGVSGLLCPSGGDAIVQLPKRVVQRDVGVKARTGGHHHVGRDGLQVRVGMLLQPHDRRTTIECRCLP